MKSNAKIALVTGSSKGIGRGIALALAEAGWDVAVNYYRDSAGGQATADAIREQGRQAWVLQADVGNGEQVTDMFRQIQQQAGELGLLVNNSATQTWAPLLELEEADWDRTINTNLKGTFLCTQQAARMMKQTGGSIINIGSGANQAPFTNLIDYCATKGGIENITKVAAVELGQYSIRVNCVAPGAIEIERTKQESPDYAGTWSPLTPLGRIGKPLDIARAVVFLSGNEADFITGQTLYVDGGLFTKPQWPY